MGPTVLVVDDSAPLRAEIRRTLEEAGLGLHVLEAGNGAEALATALSGDVDVVISDVVMPELDGIGLLRAIRQQRDADSLPVILVTSQADQEVRTLGFELGVSDFVTRPVVAIELVSRVQVQLRLKTLQEELRRTGERERRLAHHDALTGAANRTYFINRCRQELARCRRHKLAISICFVDIDALRKANNRVGHLVGDAIIAEVAELLGKSLRSFDVVGRMGAGRFAVILQHAESDQGRVAAERLCERVRNHAFAGHQPGEITVSAGIATYPVAGLESVDELLNAAEACLDRAKALGGARVAAWSDQDKASRGVSEAT